MSHWHHLYDIHTGSVDIAKQVVGEVAMVSSAQCACVLRRTMRPLCIKNMP